MDDYYSKSNNEDDDDDEGVCEDMITTFEHLYQLGNWSKKQCETELPELFQHYKMSLEEKLTPKIEKFKSYLYDVSPVGDELFVYQYISHTFKEFFCGRGDQNLMGGLLEGYSWITICLLASSIGYTLGGAIISLLISSFYAWLITFFVIPGVLIHLFASGNPPTDDVRRLNVFFASVANGVLSGCMLASCSTTVWAPPTFALPVSIAFSTVWYSKHYGQQPRPIFVAVSLFPGVALQVFLGVFVGLPFGRLFWIVLLTAVASFDLQVKINQLRDGSTIGGLEQYASIAIFNLIGCLCVWMFADGDQAKGPTAKY